MLDLSCIYDTRQARQFDELRAKIEDPSLFTQEELDDLAIAMLADLETYTAIMFIAVEGYRFQVRPFHRVLFRTLEEVRLGIHPRLIINIPPGFGKTHVFRSWAAQSYQQEPRCKFLHLSYSKTLVDDNSSEIKDILETPIAWAISAVMIKADSSGKALWKTNAGGVFRATQTGGQVTGFRAGRLGLYVEEDFDPEDLAGRIGPGALYVEEGFDPEDSAGQIGVEAFCGAAVIDDPVKPEDANSQKIRDKINRRYPQTIASRLATERVPIVVIMQRIHGMDLSGYLLGGGSGEYWHHLVIPDEIRQEDVDPSTYAEYGRAWVYGVPLHHGLPVGPIWPEKLDADGIVVKRQNDHTYQAQYRQRPKPEGGRMFKRQWFPRYKSVDGWNGFLDVGNATIKIEYYMVFADTAQKKEEIHDYSVFEIYAKLQDGRIALIDMIRGKYEAPELQRAACVFLDRYEYRVDHWGHSWRQCMIEDKVSGTGLIQYIKNRYPGRIEPKQRNRDKFVRACDTQPHVTAGRVLLPESALWLEDFLTEVEQFSRALDHDFDDQCEGLFDACEEMLDGELEADYGQFSKG